MRRLLVWAPDVDAVFAANDLMAFGALAVLAAAGRRVPDDVAVVGFDDVPEATLSEPPLTTVRQPIEEMGVTHGAAPARPAGRRPRRHRRADAGRAAHERLTVADP